MANQQFRDRILAGQAVFGFMTNIDSVDLVEILCGLGIDYVVVDAEHGAFGVREIGAMVRATRGSGVAALVRVPAIGSHYVQWACDLGADGIVFPQVEDATAMRSAVAAVRYPPRGARGLHGWTRAARWGAKTMAEHLDQEDCGITTVAQIETRKGLENVEEIVAVDGVDILLVGPTDLAASLGLGGQGDHPEVQSAIRSIFRAAGQSGVRFGSGGDPVAQVRDFTPLGATFILGGAVSSVVGALLTVCQDVRAAMATVHIAGPAQ